MKKVLIITYYWPPAGGPGVQRWLKFVKYLPDYNVQPIVYDRRGCIIDIFGSVKGYRGGYYHNYDYPRGGGYDYPRGGGNYDNDDENDDYNSDYYYKKDDKPSKDLEENKRGK